MIYEFIFILIAVLFKVFLNIESIFNSSGNFVVTALNINSINQDIDKIGLISIFAGLSLILAFVKTYLFNNKKTNESISLKSNESGESVSKSYLSMFMLIVFDCFFIAVLLYFTFERMEQDIYSWNFFVYVLSSYWLGNLVFSMFSVIKTLFKLIKWTL